MDQKTRHRRAWPGKRLKRSRKAEIDTADTAVQYVVLYGIILAAIILAYIYLIFSIQSPAIPEELDERLMAKRFTDNCFVYRDDVTGRAYPGIIDLPGFTQDMMDTCYPARDPEDGYMLMLSWDGQKESLTLRTSNWADNQKTSVNTRKVIVYSKGGYSAGELDIYRYSR